MLNALYKGLVKAVLAMIVVGAAFIFMANNTASQVQENRVEDGPTYPEQIAAKHNCWMGEAPADVEVPGHVVVRYEGDVAARYLGPKAVADALNYLFDDTKDNHGVAEVYAFCR